MKVDVDLELELSIQEKDDNYSINNKENNKETPLIKNLKEYIELQSRKKQDSINKVVARCNEFTSFLTTYNENITDEKNLLLNCLQEKINCNWFINF